MKYEEILAIIKEKVDSVSSFGYGDFDSQAIGLGVCVKDIHRQGGEGEGENWRRVHYFADHNVYIETRAWYQSYDGATFDGWDDAVRQVKPTQRTVTFYE